MFTPDFLRELVVKKGAPTSITHRSWSVSEDALWGPRRVPGKGGEQCGHFLHTLRPNAKAERPVLKVWRTGASTTMKPLSLRSSPTFPTQEA